MTNPTGSEVKGGTPIFTESCHIVLRRASVENNVEFRNALEIWWIELSSGQQGENMMVGIRVEDDDWPREGWGVEMFQNERRVTREDVELAKTREGHGGWGRASTVQARVAMKGQPF